MELNNLGDICRINISIDLKPHSSDLTSSLEIYWGGFSETVSPMAAKIKLNSQGFNMT